ncbi:3-deoxy-D-manno-octulosonic acid transferase [Aerophototrophica crusticola]|uniref:3-deoxy-D-manno-octulosonic acid transferase n=2 Tax=Aerophototrophica crusticola TaxID=1709002 RepID=A0A858RCL1_9PROT|nr:3-deoxy-D-manno-octulosonic acid transferase [Rhodospirillaceae bacterium B3]
MLETLYRGLTHLAGPAVRRLLDKRAARGKEDPDRRGERLGHAGLPRPAGRLAWIHAASVGESLAVLPLVDRLLARDPDLSVLVTTGTVTSAGLMAQRLPARAFHQYVPVDLAPAVDRFLEHWRPDLVLWVESEFWPNLLAGVRRRRIPAALVNARLSEKSFHGWRRVPGTARRLLSVFRLALAQTAAEAQRLKALGIADTRTVGNLKYSAKPLPCDDAELARLTDDLLGRPRWCLASSHAGEEELALAAHKALAGEFPGLLTLLAPRHPARGEAVAALLQGGGLTVARRSLGEAVTGTTDIYLLDTMGEMGLAFRLAPVTVVGGSFVPVGGHNPIEPALLGSAVLHGPQMFNFAEVAAELAAAGGAVTVADADGLARELRRLLSDQGAREGMADSALAVAEHNRQAVDRVMEALGPVLDAAGVGQGGRT